MIRHSVDPPNAEPALADVEEGPRTLERFYVRCNFGVPRLNARHWRLEVTGAFERPRSWTLSELASLPPVERTVVLECAGNGRTLMQPVPPGTPWGLGAVGVARFGGIRLADLLAESRPRSTAVELVFSGADHGTMGPEGSIPYQFNLDLADAAWDGPMLAWTMGGGPLSADHGFPVRLVVPGQYGMRSVKWLTSISAVEQPFEGHFPRRYRYRGDHSVPDDTPVGPIRVRSLVTWPANGDHLPAAPLTLRGIAWSGHGPITRVEVRADGGWMPAQLWPPRDEAGPTTWAVRWSPTEAGPHVIAVRATDAAGNRQPTEPVWNEGGYGNNVIQQVSVTLG